MESLTVYLLAGFAYWLACLLARGESPSLRACPPGRRLKIHLVALGLSLALWPVALANQRER